MITGWICSEKARTQSKTIESPSSPSESQRMKGLAMCGTVIKILFFRNMCYNTICMCGDSLSAHSFQSV